MIWFIHKESHFFFQTNFYLLLNVQRSLTSQLITKQGLSQFAFFVVGFFIYMLFIFNVILMDLLEDYMMKSLYFIEN